VLRYPLDARRGSGARATAFPPPRRIGPAEARMSDVAATLPRPAEEAKGFPWGGAAWTAIGVLLALLLFLRRSVGGVDQWMFPVLGAVRVCYGAAVVLSLASLRWRALRLATGAVLLGFTTSLFLVVTRGLEAGRWPSQSKFEVFFNPSMTVPAALLLL